MRSEVEAEPRIQVGSQDIAKMATAMKISLPTRPLLPSPQFRLPSTTINALVAANRAFEGSSAVTELFREHPIAIQSLSGLTKFNEAISESWAKQWTPKNLSSIATASMALVSAAQANLGPIFKSTSFAESLASSNTNLYSSIAAAQRAAFADLGALDLKSLFGVGSSTQLAGVVQQFASEYKIWTTGRAISVEELLDRWLDSIDPGLSRKRAGTWHALRYSPDPVTQAASSAVELMLAVIRSFASDTEVLTKLVGTPHEKSDLAYDSRTGQFRVTWKARLRVVAQSAGLNQPDQESVMRAASAGQRLQDAKHRSNLYTTTVVRSEVNEIEDALKKLAKLS